MPNPLRTTGPNGLDVSTNKPSGGRNGDWVEDHEDDLNNSGDLSGENSLTATWTTGTEPPSQGSLTTTRNQGPPVESDSDFANRHAAAIAAAWASQPPVP